MRAVQIDSTGRPGAVVLADVPAPTRKDDEVLIDVEWAGVSFPDVLQSKGLYQIQPPTPFIPGAEVAGIVREAPEGGEFAVGQAVAAFPGFGGFGECVAVPTPFVLPLSAGLDTRTGPAPRSRHAAPLVRSVPAGRRHAADGGQSRPVRDEDLGGGAGAVDDRGAGARLRGSGRSADDR